MNLWFQSRLFRCPSCGAVYLHDKGHHHAVFECPLRPMMKRRMPVLAGKSYEPKAGR